MRIKISIGSTWPLLPRLFSSFSQYSDKFSTIHYKWKRVYGVLGIRTRDHRMEVEDESTELLGPNPLWIDYALLSDANS